jgi:hypothetical protein
MAESLPETMPGLATEIAHRTSARGELQGMA